MKRFISALTLCISLLVVLSLFLFPPVEAKENTLLLLLNLPAPPPPNPEAPPSERYHPSEFYDRDSPPKDDAPIEDLIDYWKQQAAPNRLTSRYHAIPSDRTVQRLVEEMSKDPDLAVSLLNALPDNDLGANAVKQLYEQADDSNRATFRSWLRYNSDFFSHDLETVSARIRDENDYVSIDNERTLLALTRHDFEKASPIINRLYQDTSQPVTRVLATWALYKHALETDSVSDVERYRADLMHMVEDRTLPNGVRDKANDALTHERDFPGRDDWTLSLFEDETLVNITEYTMLTTLSMYSPPEKIAPKLIALLNKTSNVNVRTAAARSLMVSLNSDPGKDLEKEIIVSLLPWLEDPDWARDAARSRGDLVRKLSEYQIRESVPGLIHMLNEKEIHVPEQETPDFRGIADLANTKAPMATTSLSNSTRAPGLLLPEDTFPYRSAAIQALAKQEDQRAVPALRRILPVVVNYERQAVVGAILACGGFTVGEQMDALEASLKRDDGIMDIANRSYPDTKPSPLTSAEIKTLLGQQLMRSGRDVSDELARAVVDRIEALDKTDPTLAAAFRRVILSWRKAVVDILLLKDLKNGIVSSDAILRALGTRKFLREKHPIEVSDLHNGSAVAAGIAPCMLDDTNDYNAILESGGIETRTAMLACARLLRAPLPVNKVIENLSSKDELLRLAAERYLESEDSTEARLAVLSLHPGEAKIMGATTAFFEDESAYSTLYLWYVFASLGYNAGDALYEDGSFKGLKEREKRLHEEVKKDASLVGVYAYDSNYIRIYKDRVVYSWDEDESRYRERELTKNEFDEIKSYLASKRADQLPPFLACSRGCVKGELIMLGKNGGRRVFFNRPYPTGRMPYPFFAGLDEYFKRLKQTKAEIKYGLSREIPGLEIVFASDDLKAATVWKEGSDLRVAAADRNIREKIQADINAAATVNDDSGEQMEPDEIEQKKTDLAAKKRFEGFAWYRVAGGETAGLASQPAGIELIPFGDGLTPPADQESWKARAGETEFRVSDEALFKVQRGKMTKIRDGIYGSPIITPNGRWLVVDKSNEENGTKIVRIDLSTNKEYDLAEDADVSGSPTAFLPTLNKVLLVERYDDPRPDDPDSDLDDPSSGRDDSDGMYLIDPVTGKTQTIAGEFRPLSQQTFRPLQKTGRPNEYWAAIPNEDKNETEFGIYDTNHFGLRTLLRIPKIRFNSMKMWVDEAGGKIYFVYRGQILSLPLPK